MNTEQKEQTEVLTVSVDKLYGLPNGTAQHPNKPNMDGIRHQYTKLLAEGWQLVRCEGNVAVFERRKR